MRFAFGIWTMIVALTVSAVAAYYSIVGLTAIFAAAVIPVIIMGATLEVAKVTAAIWLHSFWDEGAFLTKVYLTSAVVILMFITSMGIFGFLSKAHIEQGAGVAELGAQIERIDEQIARQEQNIDRALANIDSFDERVDDADVEIQARIDAQERIIADIRTALERDIAVQNQVIDQELGTGSPLEAELAAIEERRAQLNTLLQDGDVRALQAFVGAPVDGVRGPNTNAAIAAFEDNLNEQRTALLATIQAQRNADNPAVDRARERISELQAAANAEIARAQSAIEAFRQQLVSVTTADNSGAIAEQEAAITVANSEIDTLVEQKFELEGQLRVIEVEVGPVRYIAELVYGDTSEDLLEQAVRWVIIIIVLVFDPLAIVLVLAGISLLHRKDTLDKPAPDVHNENTESEEPPDGARQEGEVTPTKRTQWRTPAPQNEPVLEEPAADDLSESGGPTTDQTTDDQAPVETEPKPDREQAREDDSKRTKSIMRLTRPSPPNGSPNDK